MATGNFYNENASKIFACEIQDEFDYDCLVDNLKNGFSKFDTCPAHDSGYNHSFPENAITGIFSTKYYHEFEVSVILTAIIRSGYYSGVNLDWEVHYEVNGETIDTPDFAEILEYQLNSRAIAHYKAKFAGKWAENTASKLIEQTEDIFSQYSTPLVVWARFSNGETTYTKADSLRGAIAS